MCIKSESFSAQVFFFFSQIASLGLFLFVFLVVLQVLMSDLLIFLILLRLEDLFLSLIP